MDCREAVGRWYSYGTLIDRFTGEIVGIWYTYFSQNPAMSRQDAFTVIEWIASLISLINEASFSIAFPTTMTSAPALQLR